MVTIMLNILNKFMTKFPRKFLEMRSYSKIARLSPELEECFNKQINLEFFASFNYLAMSNYFGRQTVALPGCYKFFLNQCREERCHAERLIEYLNSRGSFVVLQTIEPPKNQKWDCPLAAFKDAMNLEARVAEALFGLHKKSSDLEDICSCNLLENNYLDGQLEEYNKLARIVTQLENIGNNGLGIYLFDINLLKECKEDT